MGSVTNWKGIWKHFLDCNVHIFTCLQIKRLFSIVAVLLLYYFTLFFNHQIFAMQVISVQKLALCKLDFFFSKLSTSVTFSTLSINVDWSSRFKYRFPKRRSGIVPPMPLIFQHLFPTYLYVSTLGDRFWDLKSISETAKAIKYINESIKDVRFKQRFSDLRCELSRGVYGTEEVTTLSVRVCVCCVWTRTILDQA